MSMGGMFISLSLLKSREQVPLHAHHCFLVMIIVTNSQQADIWEEKVQQPHQVAALNTGCALWVHPRLNEGLQLLYL